MSKDYTVWTKPRELWSYPFAYMTDEEIEEALYEMIEKWDDVLKELADK